MKSGRIRLMHILIGRNASVLLWSAIICRKAFESWWGRWEPLRLHKLRSYPGMSCPEACRSRKFREMSKSVDGCRGHISTSKVGSPVSLYSVGAVLWFFVDHVLHCCTMSFKSTVIHVWKDRTFPSMSSSLSWVSYGEFWLWRWPGWNCSWAEESMEVELATLAVLEQRWKEKCSQTTAWIAAGLQRYRFCFLIARSFLWIALIAR